MKKGYKIIVFKWVIWISGCQKKMLCNKHFFLLRRVVWNTHLKMEKQVKFVLRDFCQEIHGFLFIRHNLFQWLEEQVLIKRLSQIFLVSLVPCMQNLTSLSSQCWCIILMRLVLTNPTGFVTQVARKVVYSIAAAEKRKTYTIMMCKSVIGNVLPFMIIFPQEHLSN